MKAVPKLETEIARGFPRLKIAGVDEVGAGCIAGPVCAAVALLPPQVDYDANPWLAEVRDSKLISAKKREELSEKLKGWLTAYAIVDVSVEEVDRINIFHARYLAMKKACESIRPLPEHILVDGNQTLKGISIPSTAVVKGDLNCLSIACASILAKVYRDSLMDDLDVIYPGYGLAKHKGYGTPEHKKALQKLGATKIHRRSFAPVAEVLKGSGRLHEASEPNQESLSFN